MDFDLPDTTGLPQVEMPDFDFSLPDLPLHQAGNQPADADVPRIALGDPLVPVVPSAPVTAGAAATDESPNLPAAQAFVARLPPLAHASKAARYRALEAHRQARPEAVPWSESTSRLAAGGMSAGAARQALRDQFLGTGGARIEQFLARMRDEVPGFDGMSKSDKYRTLLRQTGQPSEQGRWSDRDLRRMADGLHTSAALKIKNEPEFQDAASETDETRTARRVLADAPEDVRSDEEKYRYLLQQVRDRPVQAGLGTDTSLRRAAGLSSQARADGIKREAEFSNHSPFTLEAMEVLASLPSAEIPRRDRHLNVLREHNRGLSAGDPLPYASMLRAAFFFRPAAAVDLHLGQEASRAQALLQQLRSDVPTFDSMARKDKYRALLRAVGHPCRPSDWPDVTLRSLAGGISNTVARDIRNEPEFSAAGDDSPTTATARRVLAEAPEQERDAEEKYRVLMRHRRDHPGQLPRLTGPAMRRAADGISLQLARFIDEEPEFKPPSEETLEAVRVLAAQPPESRLNTRARSRILQRYNRGLPQAARLPMSSRVLAARHFDRFDLSTLARGDDDVTDDAGAGPGIGR